MNLEEKRQRLFASMHNGGDVVMVFPLLALTPAVLNFQIISVLMNRDGLAPFRFIYCFNVRLNA
jgi:hypothetical protein